MAEKKHGVFLWNELLTNDVDAAKAFYSEALGWMFDDVQMPHGMTYHVAKLGDQMVAGVMKMPEEMPPGTPPHWMAYIEVDDVDKRVARAREIGAEICTEPFDVPTVGRIAILKDPTGGVIGWMTSADAQD